jgi:hypothetical protein
MTATAVTAVTAATAAMARRRIYWNILGYRVVQSQNLHGFGVCLTDELFIKMEYNRPPEAVTNHSAPRQSRRHTKHAFIPFSFFALRDPFLFWFFLLLSEIHWLSFVASFHTKTRMRIKFSAVILMHRE